MENVIVKTINDGVEQTFEVDIALLMLANIEEDGQNFQAIHIAKEISTVDLMMFYTNAMTEIKKQATEFQLETFEKWMKERK
jgi:hypothetical protein